MPFRAFNGTSSNAAFWAASQSDILSVPMNNSNVLLGTSDGQLHFPGGKLGIVGLGANMTLSRGIEFILKFE